MKYFILRIPILVWLLLFSLIQIFILSMFLPAPFDSNSFIPMGVLAGCTVGLSNEVKEKDGQYKPFKYLWWMMLGGTLVGILFGITMQVPLEKHIVLLVQAITGGICYRLIERYAIYRYHYLQTKKKG